MLLQKFVEITADLMSHCITGHSVMMTRWRIMRRREIGLHLDGNLLSVQTQDVRDIYPMGQFQCGNCNKMTPMNEDKVAYFHKPTKKLCCTMCAITESFIQMRPLTYRDTENGPELHMDGYIEIIDDLDNISDEDRAHTMEVGRKCAEVNNYIFLDGKGIEDIRRDILAKRVLHAFDKNLYNKRLQSLYNILYSHVGIGHHAAIDIAERLVKPLLRSRL